MQTNEDLILEILYKNSGNFELDGEPVEAVGEGDFTTVARQILSVLQPNSDPSPQLQQAPCTTQLSDDSSTEDEYCKCEYPTLGKSVSRCSTCDCWFKPIA